ncbi:MAG: FAD-dependent oxidoreductase [Clostridia bacterium]|nr:FAD-dependent oxidoreductase [Clostridia bacterium]
MDKFDVIVVGGGFSGVAAALSASRGGAKVLLVDKSNALGGASVNCLVNPFMVYWTKINGERYDLSAGIFREIHDQLERRNALDGETFLEEELKFILQDMVEDAGVQLLYHANLFEVNRDGNTITSLRFATKSGAIELSADYYIDATGDAGLAYLGGCPTTLGRDSDHLCQPMTLCFRVGNADVEAFNLSRPRFQEAYKKALASGEITNPRENVLVFRNPAKGVLHFNTTRVVKKNPVDPFDVTEAEILARKQVREIYEFLKIHADGLENSFLMSTAGEIGVRESRMIIGDYILTESDCRSCVKFDDAIAVCNYDIDIHNPEGSGTSHYYFPDGEYYSIPYRSLIPKKADNLLVVGRCISSDHGAQASYRIMPTVCTIGEAGGTAIALAVKNRCSTRQVDIKTLQKTLVDNGAVID